MNCNKVKHQCRRYELIQDKRWSWAEGEEELDVCRLTPGDYMSSLDCRSWTGEGREREGKGRKVKGGGGVKERL